MRFGNRVLVVTALALVAGPVLATPISYVTTLTSIFSGGVFANYDSVTGLSKQSGNCYLQGGGTGPCATLVSNPVSNILGLTSSSVAINGGVGFNPQNGISAYGTASALADLSTGLVRASANGPNCSVPNAAGCGSGGYAAAQFQDGITFNNTSGNTANITVDWAFDGTTSSLGTSPRIWVHSLFCLAPGPFCSGIANSPLHGVLNGGQYFYFSSQDGTILNNDLPTVDYVSSFLIPGANATSETFQGVMAIPTGQTTYTLNAYMELYCLISTCDFTHTGAFSLGALPQGVSFTSNSQVLLTSTTTTPEPATWTLSLSAAALLALWKKRGKRFAGSPSGAVAGSLGLDPGGLRRDFSAERDSALT